MSVLNGTELYTWKWLKWSILCYMYFITIKNPGVPVVALQNWIWLISVRSQVRSLASLHGLRIQHCCELWCRLQTRLRPVATAPIQPLVWEPPLATGVALKIQKKKKIHWSIINITVGIQWNTIKQYKEIIAIPTTWIPSKTLCVVWEKPYAKLLYQVVPLTWSSRTG